MDHLASMVFNASSEAPTLHNKKVYAYPNQSITNVLDIWRKIEEMEKVEKELLGKIQKRLARMDSVVSRANHIHKRVKNDFGAALTYMGRLEREKEQTTRSKSSLRLMLESFKSPAHIMINKLPGTPETNKRKARSPPIAQSTEKKRREKDKVLIVPSSIDPPASSTAAKIEEKKRNERAQAPTTQDQTAQRVPALLTPGNVLNEEMDWEVATKRNRRKQGKDEKKNAGRTKAKPDAILIRKKDPNATLASVLKLMKDKLDKEQVTEYVNTLINQD